MRSGRATWLGGPSHAPRGREQGHAEDDDREREQLRHGQWTENPRVDAYEFQQEPERSDADEIAREDRAIRESAAPPANQHPGEEGEKDRLVDLRGMHALRRGRQPLGKRDAPG